MDFLTKVSTREDYSISINALKGNQFGKTVYSAQTDVQTALTIFEIDSDVQRDLNSERVSGIAKYIINRISDVSDTIYFPPFIFSARGHGKYVAEEMKFKLKINNKMIVLDGQHRLRALERAANYLNQYDKTLYNKLLDVPLSLQIYKDLTIKQERQLFSDINSKAVKVSANLIKYYSDDDPTAKMMRDIINNHPSIASSQFETRKNQTRKKLMTALVVYKIIAVLDSGRFIENDHIYIVERKKYNSLKSKTIKFLDLLVKYMPKDGYKRDKSIYLNQSVILGLAKVCSALSIDQWEDFFIKYVLQYDWSQSNTYLEKKFGIPYNRDRGVYRLTPPSKVYKSVYKTFYTKIKKGGFQVV